MCEIPATLIITTPCGIDSTLILIAILFSILIFLFYDGEGLADLGNKLSLVEEEDYEIIIEDSDDPAPKNILVVRFVSKRPIGPVDIDSALKCIWDLDYSLYVSKIGDGMFIFEFDSAVECNKILNKQQCNFKGALLIFRLERSKRLTDIALNHVPFWV